MVMRGSHGVCVQLLRRASVKADLRGGGGGSSEPSEPPLGTAMYFTISTGFADKLDIYMYLYCTVHSHPKS